MNKQLRMKIYGRVQGVFFRSSARQKARELGLKGFARNCEDGCVEIVAEGEQSALTKFKDWCTEGPDAARVEKVEEEWREASGLYLKFEIRN